MIDFATFPLGSTSYTGYSPSNQSRQSATPAVATFNTSTSGSRTIKTNGFDLLVQVSMVGYITSTTGLIGFRINNVNYMAETSSSTAFAQTRYAKIPGSSLPAGEYTIDFMYAGSGTQSMVLLGFTAANMLAYELPSIS